MGTYRPSTTGEPIAAYSPSEAPDVVDSDLEYFIETLYGERRGYIELFTIEGDPDDRDNSKRRQHWFAYNPGRKAEFIARIDELSALYGNVYASWTLYDRPTRSKAHAMPGRIIVLDDAAPGDYSFTVQTGPNTCHAYRKLSTLADVATREDLARRETYATGADKGGWDITGLIRVPGTFNTKQKYIDANGGEPYAVTLHHGSGRTFTVDELRERFPAAPAYASIDDVSADWQPAQRWIANSEQLITNGIPRRMTNPNTPGRRVLAGDLVPMSAAQLPDTSTMRYIGVKSLVIHGYPDDEARAIAWLLFGYEAEQHQGSAWLRQDIDRCIIKARAECATEGRRIIINPTAGIFVRPAAPVPTVQGSRARKDRPQRVTEAAYLAWCHEHTDEAQQVPYMRGEIATALGISKITVARLERKLREQGALERYTSADRRRSWLAVYVKPMMILPSPPAVEAVADGAEIEENRSPEVVSTPPTHIGTRVHEEEHTPPIAAAPTPGACADVGHTTGEPIEDNELEQAAAFPEVKRQRRRRPKLEDLPIDARIEELHGRLRGIGKAKSYAKWIGHDGQVHALGRRAGELRKQIAELEQQRPPVPPADALQLGLADVVTMAPADVPMVPNGGSVRAACVPPSSTVDVPPAPRSTTMHSALQTYYSAKRQGDIDTAIVAIEGWPQLADLCEAARAAHWEVI